VWAFVRLFVSSRDQIVGLLLASREQQTRKSDLLLFRGPGVWSIASGVLLCICLIGALWLLRNRKDILIICSCR
jgi:hypothetical protein